MPTLQRGHTASRSGSGRLQDHSLASGLRRNSTASADSGRLQDHSLAPGLRRTHTAATDLSELCGNDIDGIMLGRSSFFELKQDMLLLSETSSKMTVAKILVSPLFDYAIGTVIFVNAINIGIEQTMKAKGQEMLLTDALEHIFLVIYIIELCMNLYVRRLGCLRSKWIRADFFLVVVGVLTQWVIPNAGIDSKHLSLLMIFRMGRLLRLARTIRLLLRFRDLWMLVRGLVSSLTTVLYTAVLLIFIMFIFACLGIEMLTLHPLAVGPDADEVFRDIVQQNFASMEGTMLTLLAFISLDNVVTIYKPLIERDWTLLAYFASCILILGIVCMNLVTAVIVNGALEAAAQDRELVSSIEESKRKRLVKELRDMFQRLDADSSGVICYDELKNIGEEDLIMLSDFLTFHDPGKMFEALDVNEDGEIGIDEFCNGVWEVVVSKAPIEVKRMEKQVDMIARRIKEIQENQALSFQKAAADEHSFADPSEGLVDVPDEQKHEVLTHSVLGSRGASHVEASPLAEKLDFRIASKSWGLTSSESTTAGEVNGRELALTDRGIQELQRCLSTLQDLLQEARNEATPSDRRWASKELSRDVGRVLPERADEPFAAGATPATSSHDFGGDCCDEQGATPVVPTDDLGDDCCDEQGPPPVPMLDLHTKASAWRRQQEEVLSEMAGARQQPRAA